MLRGQSGSDSYKIPDLRNCRAGQNQELENFLQIEYVENNHLPTLRMIVYLIEFLNNSRFGITLNVQQLGNFRS